MGLCFQFYIVLNDFVLRHCLYTLTVLHATGPCLFLQEQTAEKIAAPPPQKKKKERNRFGVGVGGTNMVELSQVKFQV